MIPKQQQQPILQKLHNGHQGIQLCFLRAKSSVWWLHIRSDIDGFIKQCHECQKSSVLPREPLITATLPSHPWEKVTSDLFHLNNSTYLIVRTQDPPQYMCTKSLVSYGQSVFCYRLLIAFSISTQPCHSPLPYMPCSGYLHVLNCLTGPLLHIAYATFT